jgi:hypothetical protein
MNERHILEAICCIPRDLKVVKTKSVYQLLKESGYFEHPEVLTANGIQTYLHSHTDLIEMWMDYSAGKRTSSGWYFQEDVVEGKKKYIVGYYPDGERLEFPDVEEACSIFILREVWQIGK